MNDIVYAVIWEDLNTWVPSDDDYQVHIGGTFDLKEEAEEWIKSRRDGREWQIREWIRELPF